MVLGADRLRDVRADPVHVVAAARKPGNQLRERGNGRADRDRGDRGRVSQAPLPIFKFI